MRYSDAMEINTSGVGNIPYHINPNNIDNHPLMEPIIIPEFPSWIILPLFVIGTFSWIFLKEKIKE
jgi:hypothetical protein